MSAARKRECACHSGKAYTACCKPYHDGVALPPTPEALMRSRYAAFALGLGPYLVQTLAEGHADTGMAPGALALELSRVKDRRRFLGLTVHSSAEDGDVGEVHFSARVFEKGADISFSERSTFVREEGAWRYLSGEMGPYAPPEG